mgnify:CR=1 FL=1
MKSKIGDGLTTKKIFCHVHGDVREVTWSFFSSPDSQDVAGVSYPVATCGVPTHTGEEIRASYLRRMAYRERPIDEQESGEQHYRRSILGEEA